MKMRPLFHARLSGPITAPTLEHAAECGVACKTWTDCNCGLFQGFYKPLTHNGNHAKNCPCHCTCDFMTQFAGIVTTANQSRP